MQRKQSSSSARTNAHAETITNRLVQVARAYYLQDQTQDEIARALGISRSLVSRYLRSARERGIVRIHIVHPEESSAELVAELCQRFPHLKDVVIAPTLSFEPDARRVMIGRYAAQYLADVVQTGQKLALGCGRTLRAMVDALQTRQLQVSVAQAMGNIGHEAFNVDYNEIAWQVAEQLGGRAYFLSAPAILGVGSVNATEFVSGNPSLATALNMARSADAAVVGIGSVESDVLYVRSGLLSNSDFEYVSRHAVGDICGRFFDSQGVQIPAPFGERIVGLTLDEMRQIPTVIGVAGGQDKLAAVLGALRGQLINVLVSDEATIQRILQAA